MKNYYITSNVNDRNATAKTLANGEKFNVWFTRGVVRHYDEQGDLICTESATMPEDVERIDPTTEAVVSVVFNFGSFVQMGVSIHEGLTFEECVVLRGQGDVDEYRDPESGKWVKCESDYTETLEKLQALRERMDATDMVVSTTAKVEQTKTRSAWQRGVKAYALEMLEEMAFNAKHGYLNADAFSNRKTLREALLNGASDWSQYSWGGCSLIYDGDIAERLCTPSELKKTHGGERKPNASEEWLDTQARALGQAAGLILDRSGVPSFRSWEVAQAARVGA